MGEAETGYMKWLGFFYSQKKLQKCNQSICFYLFIFCHLLLEGTSICFVRGMLKERAQMRKMGGELSHSPGLKAEFSPLKNEAPC